MCEFYTFTVIQISRTLIVISLVCSYYYTIFDFKQKYSTTRDLFRAFFLTNNIIHNYWYLIRNVKNNNYSSKDKTNISIWRPIAKYRSRVALVWKMFGVCSAIKRKRQKDIRREEKTTRKKPIENLVSPK